MRISDDIDSAFLQARGGWPNMTNYGQLWLLTPSMFHVTPFKYIFIVGSSV